MMRRNAWYWWHTIHFVNSSHQHSALDMPDKEQMNHYKVQENKTEDSLQAVRHIRHSVAP